MNEIPGTSMEVFLNTFTIFLLAVSIMVYMKVKRRIWFALPLFLAFFCQTQTAQRRAVITEVDRLMPVHIGIFSALLCTLAVTVFFLLIKEMSEK